MMTTDSVKVVVFVRVLLGGVKIIRHGLWVV